MRSWFFISFIGWKFYLFSVHLILKKGFEMAKLPTVIKVNRKRNQGNGKINQNSEIKPYLEFALRNPTPLWICLWEFQIVQQTRNMVNYNICIIRQTKPFFQWSFNTHWVCETSMGARKKTTIRPKTTSESFFQGPTCPSLFHLQGEVQSCGHNHTRDSGAESILA